MLGVIFGRYQIRINYKMPDQFMKLNLKLLAPISVFGSITGSPVDRSRIPFWNWVAKSIFDSETLTLIKQSAGPITEVHPLEASGMTPVKDALLAHNFKFLREFGFEYPSDAAFFS